MSAVVESRLLQAPLNEFSLLEHANDEQIIAWRGGHAISKREFLEDVAQAASRLPVAGSAINLCDDRYLFLVGFCAAASLGHASLLPSSRAPQAIADVRMKYAASYLIGESRSCDSLQGLIRLPDFARDSSTRAFAAPIIRLSDAHTAVIGFTSGSTGEPNPNIKSWGNFRRGTAHNVEVLVSALGLACGEIANILATVPAQHMYGMELSVLMPLFGPFCVSSARPLLPADIVAELSLLPAPRILVTTPVHLRALLEQPVELPEIAAIVSATAPLSGELAQAAEARFGAPVIEMFGSTETCVIGHRRTATESRWRLYPDVELSPQPDGTLVEAGHLSGPIHLQDIVELQDDRQFTLSGRNADLLEIAGKRASLADLSKRLNALEGVEDAVVFQLDASDSSTVRRIAALVVAPGCSDKSLLALLRRQIDPVFLPRPLRLVERLPRNETGKLPRQALLNAISRQA